MANLSSLFTKFDIDEKIAAATEAIDSKHNQYLAFRKRFEKNLDSPLGDVVSPLTGHKFSESFEMGISTGGYPQMTLFPWLKGEITYGGKDGGSAIRAFVDAFGLLRYSTLEWRKHEVAFDPTSARVPEILTVTQNGLKYDFYSWQNGAYIWQPMAESHIGLKTAKHRELDFMVNAINNGRPLGIVLRKEAWVAELQTKITDRLAKTVREVLTLRSADFANAKLARQLGIPYVPKEATKAIMVDGVELDTTKSVTVYAFAPRNSVPMEIHLDPNAKNFEDQLASIRNAAPVIRFSLTK